VEANGLTIVTNLTYVVKYNRAMWQCLWMFSSQLFASCGDIVEVCIMKDHVGVSKGYGFVQFSSKTAASKAQKEENGKLVCILSPKPSLPFMAI
jgi:hypothetical protein